MEKNMGSADRIVRAIIAVVVIALYMTKIINGAMGIALIALSVTFLLTSLISFCPIYRPLRLNTLPKKKNS